MAFYPKARVAMDGGDLVDVTNLSHEISNGAKQVHTLRQKGAGITAGHEETKVTFDAVISEMGEEFDGLKMVKRVTAKQLRIKVPGQTITVNGSFESRKIDNASDSEIKASYSFIGHTED